MTEKKYRLSLSTGGLFYQESLILLDEFLRYGSWDEVRIVNNSNNLLQSRTESSGRRRGNEIISRLTTLTEAQLQLLASGSAVEQQYLLWIAVCKRSQFVHDFAVEVLREKYLRMDLFLKIEEYSYFFDSKAEWHEELEKLKPSTRKKMQQVLFKMMREAQLLSTEHMIIPALPTAELIRAIAQDNLNWLRVLPVMETEIQRW